MIFSVPTKDGKQNVLLDNIFDEDMTFGKICRFERNGHTIFSLTDNPPKDAVPVKDFSLTMALTYAIVDEISAERGDVADHGWLDTEFQPHSLHGSTLSAKRPEGYDHVVSPEEAESLGERFDISGRRDMGSGDFRWLGSCRDQNYQDGTDTYYNLHCNGANADGIALDETKMLAVVATRLSDARYENVSILTDAEYRKICGEDEKKTLTDLIADKNAEIISEYHQKITAYNPGEDVGRISLILGDDARFKISMTPGEPESLEGDERIVSSFSYWTEDYGESLCTRDMPLEQFEENVSRKVAHIAIELAESKEQKCEQTQENTKKKSRSR